MKACFRGWHEKARPHSPHLIFVREICKETQQIRLTLLRLLGIIILREQSVEARVKRHCLRLENAKFVEKSVVPALSASCTAVAEKRKSKGRHKIDILPEISYFQELQF